MSALPAARHLLLLFVAALTLHCMGNWALPLIDRDEPRFAEATREMRASEDWIVPTFNGAPRYDKPPLSYWLQAGACAVFGESEFAVRFPSAVCAALTSLLLAIWGARWKDAVTGLRAGIIFALCPQVLIHSRAAVADFPMILGVTLAAWLAWESLRTSLRESTGWLILATWGALAMGFLAKGPIALVPLGMVALSQGRAVRRWVGFDWLGGAVFWLVLVGAWGVPALLRTQGDFAAVGLGKHVVGRSLVALEGHGARSVLGYLATMPFYFLHIWPGAFPWTFWLPSAWQHYRRMWHGFTERFLIVGVALVFVIFTLSRTKLPHYTLPAFPFLALLMAGWWRGAHSGHGFRKVATITAVSMLVIFTVVPPLIAPQFPAYVLAQQASHSLAEETELATVDYFEPSVVWYFRKRITGWVTPVKRSKLQDWFAQPGPRAAIVPAKVAEEIYPKLPEGWRRWSARGWQVTKGQRVTLVLLYRPN